jgi:magnesium transporter
MTGAETGSPTTRPVSFILTRSHLLTVRYTEPTPFKTFVKAARAGGAELASADAIFVGLMEAIIDRAADILERIALDMDKISDAVFNDSDSGAANNRYKKVLRGIGKSGDLNSKVRESLVSLGRLLNYLGGECHAERAELREHTDLIAADIRSLTDHSTYLAGKMTFVLDATLGLINTEQNLIIKVVSVVAATLMPPTLIASTYGMNFHHMPELSWTFGYPLALIAMLIAAVAPYLVFRWKGWL